MRLRILALGSRRPCHAASSEHRLQRGALNGTRAHSTVQPPEFGQSSLAQMPGVKAAGEPLTRHLCSRTAQATLSDGGTEPGVSHQVETRLSALPGPGTTHSASSKRSPMFFSGSAAGLWARMSLISWTFFSTESTVSRYGPITPLIFKALAFSRNFWVRLVNSAMITSQRAKHWWQGAQSGKTPEYPRVHLSQRGPSTPSTQTHWPVDWSHCGVSMPLGSQSQAGRETALDNPLDHKLPRQRPAFRSRSRVFPKGFGRDWSSVVPQHKHYLDTC